MLDMWNGQRSTLTIKIFLHVQVEELEHEVNFILTMHDVHKVDDAWVIQFLQQRHFTDRRAWDALVRMLNFDFLKSNKL